MYARYVGKKLPFIFKNPNINTVLEFATGKEIVEMPQSEFDWLKKSSPVGFLEEVKPGMLSTRAVLPQAEVMEKAIEKVAEPTKNMAKKLVCENCGKDYNAIHRHHYEKHIAKCGKDDETEMD